MVKQVRDLAEFRQTLKDAGNKLVVVDFTATWCGPCQMIAPAFIKLSEDPENQNVIFLKVDVDDARDVAENCGIRSMPTFHFYKNEQKVFDFSGASLPKLKAKIEELR